MERCELIFFSTRPDLSPSEALKLARKILQQPELKLHPGSCLAVLPRPEAHLLQSRLLQEGLICNYRPAAASSELALVPYELHHLRPYYGTPTSILEASQHSRPRCRFPMLGHTHELPYPQPADRSYLSYLLLLPLLAVAMLFAGGRIDGPRSWQAALTPLAAEFQTLVQAAALHRLYQPMPSQKPALEHPATLPSLASSQAPAPWPVVQLAVPASLTKLENRLRQIQVIPPSFQSTAFPALPNFHQPLPLLPQPDARLDPSRLRVAVEQLDRHLSPIAPFLRQLYRREFRQLEQLERLFPTSASNRLLDLKSATAKAYLSPARNHPALIPSYGHRADCSVSARSALALQFPSYLPFNINPCFRQPSLRVQPSSLF